VHTVRIEAPGPEHLAAYRHLMLEAYRLHPDAFTSSQAEREALPRPCAAMTSGR